MQLVSDLYSAPFPWPSPTCTGTVKQTMRRLDPLQLSILGSEPGQDANEAFISFRLKRRIKDPETPRNAPEVRSQTCCSTEHATRTPLGAGLL